MDAGGTSVKERGILFAAPMVRALLAGTKTQTRRALKPGSFVLPDDARGGYVYYAAGSGGWGGLTRTERGGISSYPLPRCPYGVVGDRLWVREAWRSVASLDKSNAGKIVEQAREAGWDKPWAPIEWLADGRRRDWDNARDVAGRYRYARFMPRWLSRITLEITGVHVERLQDISSSDAEAEGISEFDPDAHAAVVCSLAKAMGTTAEDPRASYAALWESINGDGSWAMNPWVWALTFARVL